MNVAVKTMNVVVKTIHRGQWMNNYNSGRVRKVKYKKLMLL